MVYVAPRAIEREVGWQVAYSSRVVDRENDGATVFVACGVDITRKSKVFRVITAVKVCGKSTLVFAHPYVYAVNLPSVRIFKNEAVTVF